MVKRRVITAFFIVVGTVWLLAMTWLYLTMSAIAEPVLPLSIYLALSFAPPIVLMTSATMLFLRASRVAAICCIALSVLLTCWLVPIAVSIVVGHSALDMIDRVVAGTIIAFSICVLTAGVILLRSVIKPSNPEISFRRSPE